MSNKTTHIRVSPIEKEILNDIKTELYQNPGEKSYGDALAAVLGHYQATNQYCSRPD